jgi:GMP synthase-like glutamine amidotransferase
MAISTSFKAAVLVNSISALDPAFNAAFRESINGASPGAQIEFFDPIEAQTYPEAGQYDLIVLTGGATADASAKDIPWVLKMHDFLRITAEKHPKQKVVAVCWGHEAIHIAFGGAIGPMANFEVCHDLELRRLYQ